MHPNPSGATIARTCPGAVVAPGDCYPFGEPERALDSEMFLLAGVELKFVEGSRAKTRRAITMARRSALPIELVLGVLLPDFADSLARQPGYAFHVTPTGTGFAVFGAVLLS